MIKTSDLISFLKSKSLNTGIVTHLKVNYRPLICPFDELLNEVADEKSVFDIGCGSGQFALLLAEFTSVQKIGGIEIDKNLVINANSLLSSYFKKIDINFNVFNGKEIPNVISEYNTIFLIDVLHHIPRKFQFAFLQQVFNKMNIGTRLIIKDIDGGSPLVFFNKLHDLLFSREIGYEWSFERMDKTVSKIGFKTIKASKKQMYVYPHFTFILKK